MRPLKPRLYQIATVEKQPGLGWWWVWPRQFVGDDERTVHLRRLLSQMIELAGYDALGLPPGHVKVIEQKYSPEEAEAVRRRLLVNLQRDLRPSVVADMLARMEPVRRAA